MSSSESRSLEQCIARLKDVYKYCQIDSIQQARLENKLGLVLQNVQTSNITKCPLISCVQQAVTRKVECIINQVYHDYDMLTCDVANNFYSWFYNPSLKELRDVVRQDLVLEQEESSSSEETMDTKKDQASYIRNMGGFVNLDEKGFHQYITAVDISSSYPAAKESNNIDKSCILKAEDMEYILTHKDEFGVKEVKAWKVVDMYSPYKDEGLTVDLCYSPPVGVDLTGAPDVETIRDLGYRGGHKGYRWRFQLDDFIFDQFFFAKTNMQVKYPFVFLRQGVRPDDTQLRADGLTPAHEPSSTTSPYTFAPKAHLLLDFRKRRGLAKKQAKNKALTQDQRDFYEAKQQAIKILINSEYGSNDARFCTAYNMFESSLVTKQARYAIQNCRDLLSAPVWVIYSPTTFDDSLLHKYNDFLQRWVLDPEPLILHRKGNLIVNVKIDLVYTDTDSSYFSLHHLESRHVKDESMRHYILTTVQGHYNNFFQYFIKHSMHKLSLEFGFEHALCSAWHITRKNYCGQEVDNITCEERDNTIVPLCEIADKMDFTDYTTDELFEKYKEKKHLKITGLKIIKRNITPFGVLAYLRVMEQALNQRGELDIFNVLKQLKEEFYSMPLKNVLERKKVTVAFQKALAESSGLKALGSKFGLGETVYSFYRQPREYDPQRYHLGMYKKADLAVYLTAEQKAAVENTPIKDVPNGVFMAQYVYNVACNLLKFQNNDITETEIKALVKDSGLLLIGAPTRVKRFNLEKKQIQALIESMDKDGVCAREINGMIVFKQDLELYL